MGLVLASVARLITGAQGHWKGVPPKAEQRIYFANHQSHLDWVLVWATLPYPTNAACRALCASPSLPDSRVAATRSGPA